MKRAPMLEKRKLSRSRPFKDRRAPSQGRPHSDEWLLIQEMEEGPDEGFREATERIARGELITGRAL
jgi:hypothetical protein